MLPGCSACGCQKSAWPVSCGDGPGPAVGHDDHPCPCACFTSSSSGSAAGWSCSAVQRPPKTPGCSCCGTRSPCCAAPIPGPGSTGPAAQSSPHSPGSCRQSCGCAGSSPPAPSCAGHRSLCIHAAYRAPAPAGPTAAGSKVGLGVMPIGSVTPSDGHGPGERSPTRSFGAAAVVDDDHRHRDADQEFCAYGWRWRGYCPGSPGLLRNA
jgi:hypothetical protein